MAWAYSGNPASSEKDKFRFLISDTSSDSPILQDEEIQYVLDNYSGQNARLYMLYTSAANTFAKDIKRQLGPQMEDPTERSKYFSTQASYYKKLCSASGLSVPVYSSDKIFTKGMHDNV